MITFVHLKEGEGKWLSLDAELIMRNGEPIGTQCPTDHHVLIDARFELPYGKRNETLIYVNHPQTKIINFRSICYWYLPMVSTAKSLLFVSFQFTQYIFII